MPKISLVVVVCRERRLLARLLARTRGMHDDLVVVHDGPVGDVAEVVEYRRLVEGAGGRFVEHPKKGSLEAQSPSAWEKARHDWILRLDADEFPSEQLGEWIRRFRSAEEPGPDCPGFTCTWPLWDGIRAVTHSWPRGRIFLFNRTRVRFFGIVEQTPIPDGKWVEVDAILHHQPERKSYGIGNIMFRKQAYRWRWKIAQALQKTPLELPCWRWNEVRWPEHWDQMRRRPLRQALRRLVRFPAAQFRAMRLHREHLDLDAMLNPGLHHALIGVNVAFLKIMKGIRDWWEWLKMARLKAFYALLSVRCDGLETLGNVCAWTLRTGGLGPCSVVVAAGAGHDISFELELIRRFGCRVILLDPSPTGWATVQGLDEKPAHLEFIASGLAARSGEVSFAAPLDAEEGSYRMDEGGGQPVRFQCTTLSALMRDRKWQNIDLLKIDIEGFEYEVLSDLLKTRLPVEQICVEFHHGRGFPFTRWDTIWMIVRLRAAGFKLVHKVHWDHTFVKDGR